MGLVVRREQYAAAPVFSFGDLERGGAALIEQHRAQAAQLLAEARRQAQREAEQIRQQAREAGLAEGRERGREEARKAALAQALKDSRAELTRLQSTLRRAIEEFDVTKRRMLSAAESDLIRLALAIAERVATRVAAADPTAARANAARLLHLVQHDHDLVLRVNPADHETIRAHLAELAAGAQRAAHVELVADAAIPAGGCRIDGRHGSVDATIPTQLARIADSILGSAAAEATGTAS